MDILFDVLFIVFMTMGVFLLWMFVDEKIYQQKYKKLWMGFIFSLWVGFVLIMPLERILG